MIDWIADLRDVSHQVDDQGLRESCLALANTYVHEREQDATLSAEYLHWASGNHGRRGTIAAATAALASEGQPPRAQWEFDSGVDDSLPTYVPPPAVVGGFANVTARLVFGIDEVVRTLVSGRLVVLALRTSPEWMDRDVRAITTGLPRGRGHAVVAVGVGLLTPPLSPLLRVGDRVICIRNSWGAAWGARGYALLTETAFAESVDAGIVLDV